MTAEDLTHTQIHHCRMVCTVMSYLSMPHPWFRNVPSTCLTMLATNPNPNISLVKPPCVFGRICSISLSHRITSHAIVFPVYPRVIQTLFPSGSYPHYSYVVKSPNSTLLFYLTYCIPTLSLGYPYVWRFKPLHQVTKLAKSHHTPIFLLIATLMGICNWNCVLGRREFIPLGRW
jgi:hypothetical protein